VIHVLLKFKKTVKKAIKYIENNKRSVVKRKKSSTIRRIRRDKSLFSPAKANTFEKFFITTIITGFATGMGIVLGT
jgi:hypothetical protein